MVEDLRREVDALFSQFVTEARVAVTIATEGAASDAAAMVAPRYCLRPATLVDRKATFSKDDRHAPSRWILDSALKVHHLWSKHFAAPASQSRFSLATAAATSYP